MCVLCKATGVLTLTCLGFRSQVWEVLCVFGGLRGCVPFGLLWRCDRRTCITLLSDALYIECCNCQCLPSQCTLHVHHTACPPAMHHTPSGALHTVLPSVTTRRLSSFQKAHFVTPAALSASRTNCLQGRQQTTRFLWQYTHNLMLPTQLAPHKNHSHKHIPWHSSQSSHPHVPLGLAHTILGSLSCTLYCSPHVNTHTDETILATAS